ncbi:hypothetical protein K491DRAFT_698722 [Lophiostoma macrostomum CBS 122681]|uniref:UBX domain-containing protein n=1 Tax=Lophiostoma macrostomum CBS 122681 TaxID=1314788 RepID=A0A6A6SLS9_9PLEO|nr:hypothetical protein K491DRAFT_698722 [Lophiostoma macrostomum CBS 122681]
MFHEGSLQSGISLAIQEQKLVACFVRDDSEESSTWETEWLQSGWLSGLLVQKAVVLRLEAGSTEAGFLSAFCPISNIPTIVVIQDGQLREQVSSGVGQDEFINRIRKVLGAATIPTANSSASAPTSSSPPPPALSAPPSSSSPLSDETPPVEDAVDDRIPVSPILPPSSKAKGKQKATPPGSRPDISSANAAQQAARDALRKKKQEEKDELARIKARIEANKAERKAAAEAQKAERERLAATSNTSSSPMRSTSNKGSQAKNVNLNVRLFDGRTIRSSFPRTAKLQDDVRPWVDREFVARAEDPNHKHPPYYFKQILAPLPSRELSAGEENETLGDIDLAPSATLVLIPVKGYTEAYASGSGGVVGGTVGAVTGLVGGVFGVASSAVGYVGSTLGSIVGYGSSASQETEQSQQNAQGRTLSENNDAQDPSNIRVRTLADQRAREPRNQEFYNGNQLSFEPNPGERDSR